MPTEPPLNRRMLVRRVVIDEGVDRHIRRRLRVEQIQKFPKFLMPITRQTRADDGAFEDIQRGEQGGRAVSFVVMSHRAGPAGLHRQAGLRPLQRLDLALFVDTEDQGLLGRIHVEPDDIGELLEEPRVGRQLERAQAVRLQPVRVPNPVNRRRAQSLRGGHRAQTPVGRPWRLGVQRRLDDLLLAGRGDLALAPPARGIASQGGGPPGREPAAPQPHGILARVELVRDVLARQTVSCEQHDPAPQHHARRCRTRSNPALQRRALLRRHRQSGGSVHVVHGTKPQLEVQDVLRSLH